MRTNLTKF